jgi:hypothetical protein
MSQARSVMVGLGIASLLRISCVRRVSQNIWVQIGGCRAQPPLYT